MLVLKALENGAEHGYGIARSIETAVDNVLQVPEGSLYPALHRMENRGWVKAEWGRSENGRRARFYRLTRSGRRQVEQQLSDWRAYTLAVDRMMSS